MIPAGDQETIETLRARLAEAEETLRAIRQGEIDALVVEGADGHQVYTLHSAEEPYRNLVEQMQEGAVVLTRGGDITYANTRFAELVGEPLTSVVGSCFDRFIGVPDRGTFENLLAAGGGRRRCRVVGAAGAFEASLSLTTTASANGGHLNLIVTDLSELFEATSGRERAQHDSRTKDEFLAMLAHELRNPLGVISSAVGVLERTAADEEPAIKAHATIARQISHIAFLINELLDVERMVSGRVVLNRKPLDLDATVRRVAGSLAGAAAGRPIDVRGEPLWIDADTVRIEQVLTNLLTNAVKYSPPDSLIRVAIRAEGGDVVLAVEDSGFGIAPALLPFIFDLYVQGDRTLDRARGGLGIGLTLVRRLVELHGGTIAASSEGEGRGSTFTVRLKQVAAPQADASRGLPSEGPALSRRVLLIEDSDDAREMLRTVLELGGHVVYDAPDGVRGLELWNAKRPDVGIIDIGLPRMDGYQVAKRIREDPLGRAMLLLALTGDSADEDPRRTKELGFDYHLVKPVDIDQLTRLISARAS